MASIWIAVGGGRTFVAGGPDVGTPLVKNDLTKAAGDAITLAMDFGDLPELWAGATITSCTIAALPSGLTIGTPAVNSGGYAVSASFSGGTAAASYAVTFTATLSTGDVIARTATLNLV
jgi:hypothetical protein